VHHIGFTELIYCDSRSVTVLIYCDARSVTVLIYCDARSTKPKEHKVLSQHEYGVYFVAKVDTDLLM
jgi:hypothetical protein